MESSSMSRRWSTARLGALVLFLVAAGLAAGRTPTPSVSAHEGPGLTPASVEETIPDGGQATIDDKTVHTPAIPPLVDVCLLEDETGSFTDDIGNLQGGTTAQDIFNAVTGVSPNAHFAVAGFRDYPVFPYGNAGDWVYRRLSGMSPALADWLAGIGALTAGGGNDIREAQYDAIVAAAGPGVFADPTMDNQPDCGWRALANVVRVLVVATDAPFHTPDGTHVNDGASTLAALNARSIQVVGLKAPGAGGELDALAAGTGGSVQPLSSDGSDIGAAIVAGLSSLPVTVSMASDCDTATGGVVTTSFAPAAQVVTSGADAVFVETISVSATPEQQGHTYECDDWALLNGEPMTDATGAVIKEHKIIRVPDTTPPRAACVETTNPAGRTVPPAGSTTLPGPKGGQNEDGFYELLAEDIADPNPGIFVMDSASPFVAGPFANGDRVKVTQAPGAKPNSKPMAGVIVAHITLKGDALVYAMDAAGNKSEEISCLVPPPPK